MLIGRICLYGDVLDKPAISRFSNAFKMLNVIHSFIHSLQPATFELNVL